MGAAFKCKLVDFSLSTATEKLGRLASAASTSGFVSHYHRQTEAWEAELKVIQDVAAELLNTVPGSANYWILFEYEIPRRQRRPDVVLLADDLIFVIEFKVGMDCFAGGDAWQVYSYALDLRDFHAESQGRTILPILVVPAAPDSDCAAIEPAPEEFLGRVAPTQKANATQLAKIILRHLPLSRCNSSPSIDPERWEHSSYRPTPTIIEAAEMLFAGHGVADISHAFASNLSLTTAEIIRAVQSSQAGELRTICFVTGTPGAGKTLAGLNAVHDPTLRRNERPAAIFLSGNGPLVEIIRESLARAESGRHGSPLNEARRVVSTFVAPVHDFLKHYGVKEPSATPAEHVVVFDEAQRAWDLGRALRKLRINRSEPSLLLEVMERLPRWCTVIALVGGGQEIHTGEGGLEEWGIALNSRPVPWQVIVSSDVLHEGVSLAGHKLFTSPPSSHITVVECPALHLAVSVRSPRAKLLGEWVDGLLRNSPRVVEQHGGEFPIVLTRDLDAARQWLKSHADAQERMGLLASSGAVRLRAHGVETSSGFRSGYSYTDWFLRDTDDSRSSSRLEVAASEFECQGLELDWTCVCWGGDFLFDSASGNWLFRKPRGGSWQGVNVDAGRRNITNKYRVLLTRARRGMVIWVPRGDPADPTRDPAPLDATAEYLHENGIAWLQ
jgi:hypothetical protein